MKPCSYERLDKALFTWFTQERHRGTPLSGPIVKEKALWFHQQLNPDDDRAFTDGGMTTEMEEEAWDPTAFYPG